jgi:Co/Zn/Cd efflux system component
VALLANCVCLILLTRHRSDDLNMQSAWVCSRNDIAANLGVLLAAAGVFLSHTIWPDIMVGLLITGLFLWSAIRIVREATRSSVERGPGTQARRIAEPKAAADRGRPYRSA